MEIPTLQEVLDANSLEHKAHIKAALDTADNSEGSAQTGNTTEPMVQESI